MIQFVIIPVLFVLSVILFIVFLREVECCCFARPQPTRNVTPILEQNSDYEPYS